MSRPVGYGMSIGVRTDSIRGLSQVQEMVHYIEQQLEHHRTRALPEEYLAF